MLTDLQDNEASMELHEGPNEDNESKPSQSDARMDNIKEEPLEGQLTLVYISTPIISMIF